MKQEMQRWLEDRGDKNHNLNYDLNENSIVIDLGSYKGLWAEQILEKFPACNLHLVEPIQSFYDVCKTKFKPKKFQLINNPVKCRCVGIGLKNEKVNISLNDDATSSNSEGDTEIELITMKRLLDEWNLKTVDLLQINIEGAEYELLENWISTGLIKRFKNLQIQFHRHPMGPSDFESKRKQIHKDLKRLGFVCKFKYDFVWEGWKKK